ncbi:MAG: septum formation initiator family protein [Bacteroidota bacterium]|nr:septum formation initiator family protein [Bacteroidota bacterium]
MKGNAPKKILYLAGLVMIIAGILYICFNENGLLKLLKLKSEVTELKEQIKAKEEINKKLVGEIDSLKRNVPSKVEQVAREKYKMLKSNEKVFEIQVKDK